MRRRHLTSKLLLVLVLAGAAFAALWMGLLPLRWIPFATVSLDDPPRWFVDFRLAALRREPAVCRALLKAPHVEAAPASDQPIEKGCGWTNAYRVSSIAGARLPVDKLSCEMTAALALWLEQDVQPIAQEMLGARVTSISHMGSYSCRNIAGNVFWKDVRSQHATANALDVSVFKLADGRSVSVERDWKGDNTAGRFLRAVKARSCRYFRVSLGPDFNAAHHDHFHFDRGPLWSCR